MKILLVIFMLYSSGALAKHLETKCNDNSCFDFGWVTTEPGTNYLLEASCIDGDCRSKGWKSSDNRNSTYLVKCKRNSCFENGWVSIQKDRGDILVDIVTCKNNDCLSYGWDIATSYGDVGEAMCKNNDCRKFGGISHWRGQLSETNCIDSDCYNSGWTADILED